MLKKVTLGLVGFLHCVDEQVLISDDCLHLVDFIEQVLNP